ncbi:MAG TPA: carboxymuconolactone decarboxylase family protein [Candidatus Dormibacteraeota bacterium]|nr:carboxymuconolactone decarboxylase family protein [Candidatus Dormibacteraeota bacterium]
MTDYPELLRELGPSISELRQAIPDVWTGYTQTHRAVMVEGALSVKQKELIALAISIVKRCDGCVAAHARGAARSGASPQEVAESIGVTLLLDGGPATVWGPRAWQAYQQFAGQNESKTGAGGAG